MASRRQRLPAPVSSLHAVSVSEALSRLGMTREQFVAKQAELCAGLLQSQPFVPKSSNAPQLPLNEKPKAGKPSGRRSRSSSFSSSSSRAPSPSLPRTPARHDRVDGPSRPRDQMEIILEERSRRKATQRRDSTSRSRDDGRVASTSKHAADRIPTSNWPPETPHHYKYYSERVVGEVSASKRANPSQEGFGFPDTPSANRGNFKAPLPRYPMPKTPSRQNVGSSLPITPRSSPPPIVNLVSSPGPMRADPPEEDHLPFVLPPGPYSTVKPELSYAAIIGRAILASPNHALALQDIYEYITTVFPFYKRGEPTWMNSVRHALSTMAVFRKVQRGRSEGKSLWAVLDVDLPCFDGGGFKKSLCADMNNGVSSHKSSRKRAADDGGGSRSKRRKANDEPVPAPMKPPYFPPVVQNTNQQSYYQAACLQQAQAPAENLFPPLPASSNFHRVVARAATIPVVEAPLMVPSAGASTGASEETEDEDDLVPSSSPIERPPSSSSLPDLASSLSTSSSPTPSHLSYPGSSRDPSPAVASVPPPTMELPNDIEGDPMAAWLRSDSPPLPIPALSAKAKGKTKMTPPPRLSGKKPLRMMAPMHPPSSPTPERRGLTGPRRVFSSSKPKSPAAIPSSIAHKPASPSSVMTRLHASLIASAIAAESSQGSEEIERPSTPGRAVTPPPPSTPLRVEDLEAELIDFSPFKSLSADVAHLFGASTSSGLLPPSPSLSVFTARAPLLQGSMEDLAGDWMSAVSRSPVAPIPRTPKKSPFLGSSSTQSLRMISPFGTPSRSTRDLLFDPEDDWTRHFHSPNDLFAAYTTLGASPSPSHSNR
ncbi:hypothetical protein LXA43DRAFT_569301 [Ganoderma leucocontextum]|nr:hypothetical protein LXA43DRAFT_569301 [Ganoderma leucocontextum]